MLFWSIILIKMLTFNLYIVHMIAIILTDDMPWWYFINWWLPDNLSFGCWNSIQKAELPKAGKEQRNLEKKKGVGDSVKIWPRFSMRVQSFLRTSFIPRWASLVPRWSTYNCQRGLPRWKNPHLASFLPR